MFNIFLSLFKPNKVAADLQRRVDDLERQCLVQNSENHAIFNRQNALEERLEELTGLLEDAQQHNAVRRTRQLKLLMRINKLEQRIAVLQKAAIDPEASKEAMKQIAIQQINLELRPGGMLYALRSDQPIAPGRPTSFREFIEFAKKADPEALDRLAKAEPVTVGVLANLPETHTAVVEQQERNDRFTKFGDLTVAVGSVKISDRAIASLHEVEDQRHFTTRTFYHEKMPHWAANVKGLSEARFNKFVDAAAAEQCIPHRMEKNEYRHWTRSWPIQFLKRCTHELALKLGAIVPNKVD